MSFIQKVMTFVGGDSEMKLSEDTTEKCRKR